MFSFFPLFWVKLAALYSSSIPGTPSDTPPLPPPPLPFFATSLSLLPDKRILVGWCAIVRDKADVLILWILSDCILRGGKYAVLHEINIDVY